MEIHRTTVTSDKDHVGSCDFIKVRKKQAPYIEALMLTLRKMDWWKFAFSNRPQKSIPLLHKIATAWNWPVATVSPNGQKCPVLYQALLVSIVSVKLMPDTIRYNTITCRMYHEYEEKSNFCVYFCLETNRLIFCCTGSAKKSYCGEKNA